MGTPRIKLLIIEDDHELRGVYTDVFARDPRLMVRATHDGAHAAAMLRSEAFDAAIMDIHLPTMNGLQVAAVARSSKLNRVLPIFIVSGMVDAEVMGRVRTMSKITVIEKPFDPGQLLEKVQELWAPKQAPSKAYDVRIINSVVKGATDVFTFYFEAAAVQVGKPALRKHTPNTGGGITGLISIGGESFAGSLALVSQESLIQRLGARIFQSLDILFDATMMADIMAELANQICGRVKAEFAAIGLKAIIGLPKVVVGENYAVLHTFDSLILYVPLRIEDQVCDLEFCLVQRHGFVIDENKKESSAEGVLLF